MGIDAALELKILAEAKRYYETYDTNRLEELLNEEWAKAEGPVMPVRSDESPGKRIFNRLMKRLADNSDAVSATVGLISAGLITYLESAGYDVTDFQIPVAIIIALLVDAILGEWKDK